MLALAEEVRDELRSRHLVRVHLVWRSRELLKIIDADLLRAEVVDDDVRLTAANASLDQVRGIGVADAGDQVAEHRRIGHAVAHHPAEGVAIALLACVIDMPRPSAMFRQQITRRHYIAPGSEREAQSRNVAALLMQPAASPADPTPEALLKLLRAMSPDERAALLASVENKP